MCGGLQVHIKQVLLCLLSFIMKGCHFIKTGIYQRWAKHYDRQSLHCTYWPQSTGCCPFKVKNKRSQVRKAGAKVDSRSYFRAVGSEVFMFSGGPYVTSGWRSCPSQDASYNFSRFLRSRKSLPSNAAYWMIRDIITHAFVSLTKGIVNQSVIPVLRLGVRWNLL